jgi:hypothetical protein
MSGPGMGVFGSTVDGAVLGDRWDHLAAKVNPATPAEHRYSQQEFAGAVEKLVSEVKQGLDNTSMYFP